MKFTVAVAIGTLMKSDGFEEIGDGGKGTWEHKGVTGVAPSQDPGQLADALFNDASGNQWALVPVVGTVSSEINIKALGAIADDSTDNTLTIQAAINAAAKIVASMITNKIVIVASSVFMPAGIYRHQTLNTFTGVRIFGSGISSTLLKFTGTTGNAINIDKVSTEELFGVQFENFSMQNIAVSGSPRGISGDDGNALAIRKCHIIGVQVREFDINLFLDNSFTFYLFNSLFMSATTNNAVLKNATAGGADWCRFDVSGDNNVVVDDGSGGFESIACTFRKCTFQSSTKWGLLGIDVVAMRVLDCFFEANNQDAAADFGSVFLSDGANTRGKHYEFRGNFYSPGSGTTGQTAIKIDRAEYLETSDMIRGSGIANGLVLGNNVTMAVDKNIYNGQSSEVTYDEAFTKLFSLNGALALPSFFGEGVDLSSFSSGDANLLAGSQFAGHVLVGAFDGAPGIQGAGTGSGFKLDLNPHDGFVQSGATISRRTITTSNFTATKKTPMLISTRTTGTHAFDVASEDPTDGGEYTFYKTDDGSTINVVPDTGDAINGGTAGAILIISGAGSSGHYRVVGVGSTDWRVTFAAES
jgi:hypothetical protein